MTGIRSRRRSSVAPPSCSDRGLRKAAAAGLAEPGRSALKIMAITGHQPAQQGTDYTTGGVAETPCSPCTAEADQIG